MKSLSGSKFEQGRALRPAHGEATRARRPAHRDPTGARRPLLGSTLTLLVLAGTPLSLRAAAPNDILASPVNDISVTVYRNPAAAAAVLDLDNLQGFALITETRTVSLPAGESRIRFEGVADGIEPASAILTGLPDGLIEKNHDAQVLSPSALVAASIGHPATFVRKDPRSGQTTGIPGTLLSDAEGVVFQADSGEIEALRCSGLPETFDFEPTDAVHATPELSALVRAPRPIQAQVRLSYLARGFDWKADYSAVIAPDARTMTLGAWVTLANSNSVSFRNAHANVVAGRLNRAAEDPEPVDPGHPIRGQCWPRGSTSDRPEQPNIVQAQPLWDGPGMIRAVNLSLRFYATADFRAAAPAPPAGLQEVMVTAEKRMTVKEEQLGDLKLYRVPDRTSVVSRQIKQVRLMDRTDIPVEVVYRATVDADSQFHFGIPIPATKVLRTKNTTANHLGLSLPSGQMSAFVLQDNTPVLVYEAPFSDTTLNEDIELGFGESDDVDVLADFEALAEEGDRSRPESTPQALQRLPQVPGVKRAHSLRLSGECRIEISNALPDPVSVEVGLQLPDGAQVVRADPLPTPKDGVPTFKVTVPANGHYDVRFQSGVPPEASE